MLWGQLLLHTRIKREMAYMTYSIRNIIFEVRHFFGVLIIMILGFSAAFFALSNNSEEPIVTGIFDSIAFSYKMALGEFDTDAFNFSTYLLFFLATMLELIILINLLIAIISDSFGDVKKDWEKFSYKERAEMVRDYYSLRPPSQDIGDPCEIMLYAINNDNLKDMVWLPKETRKHFYSEEH